MENKQSGCINRDENAVNNMIKIVNHHIKFKQRPNAYRRDLPGKSFCEAKQTQTSLCFRSFKLTKDNNPLEITLNNKLINNK